MLPFAPPLEPPLVREVRSDALAGQRLGHAATVLRWRTDEAASDCTFGKLRPPRPLSLARLVAPSRGG